MSLPYWPWPVCFFVPPSKIVDYLLHPDHQDGASKCTYLTSYGFDRTLPQVLDHALVCHACPANFSSVVPGRNAMKYVFDGPLPAPNGREARLITVWQTDLTTDGAARFITARPSR